jgi:hypothetical protein
MGYKETDGQAGLEPLRDRIMYRPLESAPRDAQGILISPVENTDLSASIHLTSHTPVTMRFRTPAGDREVTIATPVCGIWYDRERNSFTARAIETDQYSWLVDGHARPAITFTRYSQLVLPRELPLYIPDLLITLAPTAYPPASDHPFLLIMSNDPQPGFFIRPDPDFRTVPHIKPKGHGTKRKTVSGTETPSRTSDSFGKTHVIPDSIRILDPDDPDTALNLELSADVARSLRRPGPDMPQVLEVGPNGVVIATTWSYAKRLFPSGGGLLGTDPEMTFIHTNAGARTKRRTGYARISVGRPTGNAHDRNSGQVTVDVEIRTSPHYSSIRFSGEPRELQSFLRLLPSILSTHPKLKTL